MQRQTNRTLLYFMQAELYVTVTEHTKSNWTSFYYYWYRVDLFFLSTHSTQVCYITWTILSIIKFSLAN
jgi:hypothetical protein